MHHDPTNAEAEVAADRFPPVAPMYRAVVGVGLGCALLIVLVYEVTRPIIRQKRKQFREQAIMDVLPGARRSGAFRLTADGSFEPTSDDSDEVSLVFAGYDENGRLIGLAIEAEAMGYQDKIRLLYGYSFETEAVIGIRVLESRETPGLGDRIETDKSFLSNFEKLDVRLTPNGDSLVHPLQFVKPGQKTAEWQIDGISGATISSRAVAEMLGTSADWWIPRVRSRKQDFESKGG